MKTRPCHQRYRERAETREHAQQRGEDESQRERALELRERDGNAELILRGSDAQDDVGVARQKLEPSTRSHI